jgi:transitional endoplasmic reticulum ATPase
VDDATLSALIPALEKSPENTELLAVVVRALSARGDAQQAADHVRRCPTARSTNEEHRAEFARALLSAGDTQAALAMSEGEGAKLRLVRARALAASDRVEDALALYRAVVAENSTLEDPDLLAELTARVPDAIRQRQGPRLKVISNDDTRATEVVRLLTPEHERTTFDDVGGLSDVKDQIRKRIILPFSKPSLFQRFKKRVGGGILLYGPPGCGKTLLARCTAGECRAAFFNVAISDVLDMYIGESERKLNALFEKARSSAPSVLFFDELEALAGKRQYAREGTSSKLVSQFLSEMDGFSQNNHGVLIIGATNVPWAIDGAFRRPGRFDRVLFVPPPDREARAAILSRLLSKRPSEGCDAQAIAGRTSGFSGADLEQVIELASDAAIEESLAADREVPIRQQHLVTALEEARSTTTEWLTTARNYARYANEGGQYDDVLEFLRKHGKA